MKLPTRRVYLPVILAFFAGCRQANQFVPPPPPTVTVAQPVERSVADTMEFIGTAEPTIMVDLRARVGGYLKQILFNDGDNVKKGDVLFVIDQAPYKVALDGAKAAQQKAAAALILAESQLRRMSPLVKSGVVTQEEFDVQSAQVATATADVAAAAAAVTKAEQDLGYTEIRAPVPGRIARHLVDVGNLVQAQVTPLANIQCIDPIYAIFDVSENDLLRFMDMLRKNQLADPDKNPPVLHLALANEQGFPHEGKLDYRDLTINRDTGTAMRRAIFPNPGWQILPGMDVKIQANVGEPKPRLLVDERAIGTDQRGDYVLVVNDKNVVEYRIVQLGSRQDGMRVIDSGLHKGDWVIVNGLQRARPGATVAPERTAMPEQNVGSAEGAPTSSAAGQSKAVSEKKAETNSAPTTPTSAASPPAAENTDESVSKPSGEAKTQADVDADTKAKSN